MTTKSGLLAAAEICEKYSLRKWHEYKRGPIDSPGRANPLLEGQSDGAEECAAALRALAAQEPDGWVSVPREVLDNFRDTILNERGSIAENGMTNDQINDVLAEFDAMLATAPTERTPAQEQLSAAQSSATGVAPAPSVPPLPEEPVQWELICKALPLDYVEYAYHLRAHAEALQREFAVMSCPIGPQQTPELCSAGTCYKCVVRELERRREGEGYFPHADGWVSVRDRLPHIGKEVWYYFDVTGVNYGKLLSGTFSGDACFAGRKGFLTGDVTHWMYAPAPPTESTAAR